MKDGLNLWLVVGEKKRHIKRLRAGLQPDLLTSYIINNRPGSLVKLAELKRDVDAACKI